MRVLRAASAWPHLQIALWSLRRSQGPPANSIYIYISCVCMRQHTKAYVSIGQSAYVSICEACYADCSAEPSGFGAYDSVRQHRSVSIRQHTSACYADCSAELDRIAKGPPAIVYSRQHTSAYVSVRLHTSAYASDWFSHVYVRLV